MVYGFVGGCCYGWFGVDFVYDQCLICLGEVWGWGGEVVGGYGGELVGFGGCFYSCLKG